MFKDNRNTDYKVASSFDFHYDGDEVSLPTIGHRLTTRLPHQLHIQDNLYDSMTHDLLDPSEVRRERVWENFSNNLLCGPTNTLKYL